MLVLALAARRGRVGTLGGAPAWSGVSIVLVVGRYFDVMAPALYGRPVNLYGTRATCRRSWRMMTDAVAGPVLAAAAHRDRRCPRIATWLALGLRRGRRRHARAGGPVEPERRRRRRRRTLRRQTARGQRPGAARSSPPVIATYWHQARLVRPADGPHSARSDPAGAAGGVVRPRAAVRGADVLLVFIESYGAVTLDRPAVPQPLAASRARFDADVAASGRQVVSAMVDSPTFGGASWLAHVSLMTGIEARDEGANQAVMSRARDTLVSTFGRAGYRTVALMPGLSFAWPEGAFYGFDRIYDITALDYTGPRFGWWSVPDQFAMARLDALESGASRRAPVRVLPDHQYARAVWPDGAVSARLGPARLRPTLCRVRRDRGRWPASPTTSIWPPATCTPCPTRSRRSAATCAATPTAIWCWWWWAITSRRPWSRARARRGTCRCTSWRAGRRARRAHGAWVPGRRDARPPGHRADARPAADAAGVVWRGAPRAEARSAAASG